MADLNFGDNTIPTPQPELTPQEMGSNTGSNAVTFETGDNVPTVEQEPVFNTLEVDGHTTNVIGSTAESSVVDTHSAIGTSKTKGLTTEELLDPNKITATISDQKNPILVLFGPPSCGKTMTLVRLTRYLKGQGYAVQPVSEFRPAQDKHYKEMCHTFNNMVDDDDAAKSTDKISFMLVKILDKKGEVICQILEGPGEYYFDPSNPLAPFPRYVNAIINSNNRKIWGIMVEPDETTMMGQENRRHYVTKVHKLKTKQNHQDKVLFIFNKVDETPFVLSPGKINYAQAMKHVGNLYPNLFAPFTNENPIMKWFKPYNFDFVAFQTGDYAQALDGTLTFQQGHDAYPRELWNKVLKLIRG